MTGGDAITLDVARQIRLLREQQSCSQQDLAEASGLSRNTLSLLERGRTSPTLATLQKIANALKVDIRVFFQPVYWSDNGPIEAGTGSSFLTPMNSSSHEVACRIDQLISAYVLHIEPGTSSGSLFPHQGEEVIYCLSGKCLYSVDEKSYVLGPGNSLRFNGRSPHSCLNVGHGVVEILAISLNIDH